MQVRNSGPPEVMVRNSGGPPLLPRIPGMLSMGHRYPRDGPGMSSMGHRCHSCHRRGGIYGATCPISHRDHTALAGRHGDTLGPRALKAPDDVKPGVRGIDDVIDESLLCREVWIDLRPNRPDQLLPQRLPRLARFRGGKLTPEACSSTSS